MYFMVIVISHYVQPISFLVQKIIFQMQGINMNLGTAWEFILSQTVINV